MYAFISHSSACEALRLMSGSEPRWPDSRRILPLLGDCISTQHDFKTWAQKTDLELYGIESHPVDLIVPYASARSRGAEARFHVWSRGLPKGCCLRLANDLVVCGPELAIIQLCGDNAKLEGLLDGFSEAVGAEKRMISALGLNQKPTIDAPLEWEKTRRLVAAAVVICEFAGTYRLSVGTRKTRYKVEPLMTRATLRDMARNIGLSSMERRALRAADFSFDNSGSPMETALALMLTLPVDLGGFGLPRPTLNFPTDVSEWRETISDRDTVIADLLWHDHLLALEYDSDEFHTKAGARQLANDAIRANILTAIGYRVLRATSKTIGSLGGISLLARQIAHLLGVSLGRPSDLQLMRRSRLYAELMPASDSTE